MTLSCTIQGNPVPIIAGSFNATYTIGNRPTGSVRVYYDGATVPGDEGDEIIITRIADSVKVFAGRITSLTVSVDEVGNKFATFRLGGHEVIADRRLVGEVYFNRSAGYIVNDIITKYLAPDGITAGTVDAGAVIPRAVFGYMMASDVLRNLAEANGFIWYIDREKALHFTERDAVTAPNGIDETTAGERSIRGLALERSLTQYRNRQLVQYNELTAVRTERFAGDGETKTWSVEFPVANTPTVEVNGIGQTVGIAGVDPDGSADFYWSKGTNSIGQDFLSAALDGLIVDITESTELYQFTPPNIPLTLISGLHVWNDYLVVGLSDTNGGYVLYKRNGTAWDQVNNLNVFTGRRVQRIVGFGSYFVGYEYYSTDAVDVRVYQIVGDGISYLDDIVTGGTAFTVAIYRGALGRHIGYDEGSLFRNLVVNVVADDGSVTTATNTNSGQTDDYRYFVGYHMGYMFILDNASVGFSGATLRQLAITANDYAITSNPTNLTGTFDRGFASTEGYAFIRTTAGIEWYKRTGASATLTKLTTLAAPSGYTFANTYISGDRWTDLDVYDDWLLVPVNESPYLLAWRINRTTDTLDYYGAVDLGLTEAPRFLNSYAGGAFAAVYNDTEIGGVYTAIQANDATTQPDVLAITYQGTFPNVTEINDFDEQAARIAVEGGTGIYEAFQSSSDTESEPNAIDIAQAILARYGRIPRVVSFETQAPFDDGAIITINWPSLGITNEEFLIERVTIRDEKATALWYALRCISGRDIGNWQEFWRSIRPTSSYDFGGSDTLPKSAAVSDMVMLEDEVTAISAATETNWDEGNWDEMEWQ
jgi:hypothetical protein